MTAHYFSNFPTHPLVNGNDSSLHFLLQLSHADEVLRDLREALLALVHNKLGPVQQVVVDLLECLWVCVCIKKKVECLRGAGVYE